jgi:hypothetical protein
VSDDPRTVLAGYVRAWRARDAGALRAVLADHATFAGPLGTSGNADEMASAILPLFAITTDVVVRLMAADGDDVITWFDLHTTVAPPVPVANWSQVRDGRSSASASPSIRARSSRAVALTDQTRSLPARCAASTEAGKHAVRAEAGRVSRCRRAG